MRKILNSGLAILTAFVLLSTLSVVVGCSKAATTTEAQGGEAALTVKTASQTKTFTMAELKKLPVFTGSGGTMSSTGNITGPDQYIGVKFTDILNSVGGITELNGVRVIAKDDYAMTFSYNQINKGANLPLFDAATGKETAVTTQPVLFLAYAKNNQPIDDDLGPLRVGIMTQTGTVTDGHWWVKWTKTLEVIAVQAPFTLNMQGAITYAVDSASFESCSAVGCHGEKWTDDQGRVWNGTPLWYLVGKVDDVPVISEGDDFRDDLADSGYTVKLKAADGATLVFTAAQVARNDTLIVAFQRDGGALPTNQWPLRLVGPGIDKSQMIGQITSIEVIPKEVALTVSSGTQTKTYSMDELKTLIPASGYGGTKNKSGTIAAPALYKGIALTALLNAIGGLKSTEVVKIIASDGYTTTFTYDQIVKGSNINIYDLQGNAATPPSPPNLLVAYEVSGQPIDASNGPLQLVVLTGQSQVTDNSLFCKKVVKIEVAAAGAATTTPASTGAGTGTGTRPATTTAATSAPPATAVTGAAILTVKGAQTRTYTLEQLKAMAATNGYGGTKTKTGTIAAPLQYKGVALADLLAAVGGLKSTDSVKITASDGFSKTLSYALANGSGFSLYDLAGNAVTAAASLVLILAYESGSQALDSTTGPLQLVVLTGQNQVTDSSNFIKMTVTIEIIPA